MPPFGVMEIFYGLAWSAEDRESYASFLREIGFQFYVYGPKADETLRRHWQKPLTPAEIKAYGALRASFAQKGLQFGMALSPQGLYNKMGLVERTQLQDKVKGLTDLGIDILGLFFDDMKSSPDMADKQLEIVHLVRSVCPAQLVFCPSYYCHDSILDFLFGDRPPKYLEDIGNGVAADIDILWTGEQIISHEILTHQLEEVTKVLKRKPFICDNFYANDGPINCNYLRLLPPTGRKREMFPYAKGWAINPMNQAGLSKLVLMAFAKFVKQGVDPDKAFAGAIHDLCSPWVAEVILAQHKNFAEAGLDAISSAEQVKMRRHLAASIGGVERELLLWFSGHYAVGMEALLNQSCFDAT
ncbi:MAG: beta-N-acetylglucosaminidase domain-containing protein [Bdellovibrionales bacterium]